MALVDSLLAAIVRADGDALVMHVGERPYIVVGTQTTHISTHDLNLEAMTGMLMQLLPSEAQGQLEEFGAVEHRLPGLGDDRFTVVAARGGDDIWIEIRRRRPAVAAQAQPPQMQAQPEQAAQPALPAQPVAPVPAASPDAPMLAAAELPPAAVEQPEQLMPVEPLVASPTPPEVPIAQLSAVDPEPAPAPVIPVVPAQSVIESFLAESESVMPVYDAPAADPEPVYEMPLSMSEIESAASIEFVAEAGCEPPIVELTPPAPTAAETWSDAFSIPDVVASAEASPSFEVIDDAAPEEQTVLAEPEPATHAVAAPEIALPAEPVHVQAEPQPEPPAVVPSSEPIRIAASIEPEPRHAPAVTEPEPPRIAAPEPQHEPGVVVPMTRTVRIEVPARAVASTRTATNVERLLRVAAARGAAALFLTSDSRPFIRVEGDMRLLESEPVLARADVEAAILEIAPEGGDESIDAAEATEWIAEFQDVGRIRCTTFVDHRGPGVLLRMIATRAATAEQLGLAREVQALATETQGLVFVAGPRGSGKSTMLSALVDLVNRQRAEFIITLERQIRLVHDNKAALVSQREIRGGADAALIAARSALRESPDVIVVDDLVSAQMVPLLLTAAAEGQLVFVSMSAPSATDAVQRFVEMATPEMRKSVHAALAESFRGAVAQVLLKKTGGGLIAAREVLLATAPVARLIGDGQLTQLPLALDSGRKHGMVSFTDALVDVVRTGVVDVREAFRKAPDRQRLLESLKRDGVDTSVVERLA